MTANPERRRRLDPRRVQTLVRCPGCAVELPAAAAATPQGYNASAECWERYGELAAYTLLLPDVAFPHQLAVDGYGAQHAGGPSKPITTVFALVGLYLACEHGLSGRAVQRAHQALSRRKREWPHFLPPTHQGELTVADVIAAAPGAPRDAALRDWTASVWAMWRDQHVRIRELVREWLPGALNRFERAKPRSQ
jgi:hypothetical protein